MKVSRPPARLDGDDLSKVRTATFRGLLTKVTPPECGQAEGPASGSAKQHVLKIGDVLQALPDPSGANTDTYFKAGDEGTVLDFYLDSTTAEELFSITWARTKKTSIMLKSSWTASFAFVRRQGLEVGDLLQVLPFKQYTTEDGTVYYKAGDEGTLRDFYEEDGEDRFSVVWARTGKISVMAKEFWFQNFRILRQQVLEVGDLLQAIPGREYVDSEGSECAHAGDEGTLEEFFKEDATGAPCFSIVWARTGKRSSCWKAAWMEHVRLLQKQDPRAGDLLQALPCKDFADAGGADVYRAEDIGKVSKTFKNTSTGERKLEILWERTGRTSTISASTWMSWYRLAPKETGFTFAKTAVRPKAKARKPLR
mmetsp:Transcript_64458/g.181362  ORF Transcript_64458/g.181362 Transcript_64458/m.181362 type:complete len:367 (+) Transcript_64458:136-1236(+)